jgi:hypothetical protein
MGPENHGARFAGATPPRSGSLDGSDVVYVAPQRMRVGTVAGRLLFSAAVSELAAGELVSSTSGLTKTPVDESFGFVGSGRRLAAARPYEM